MRLARVVPLALAMLSAAAVSQASERPPRPGQYRTTLKLVLFEVPGLPDSGLAPAREAFVEELGTGNDFCLRPERTSDAVRRKLVEHIAEGDCAYERFAIRGAAVSAAMSCTREATSLGRVTVDGRIWSENADMTMSLEQDFGLGPTRIVVRAQSARVGDC